MLSEQDAIAVVERELAKFEPLPEGDTWVMQLQHTIERPIGWVFFYGSKLFAQTGEFKHAVAGNSPFIVNRNTGKVVSIGTARPVEHYIAEYEARLASQRT